MSVLINLEIGHEAVIRSKRTVTGFTHDWHVFVTGIDNAPIHHYVDKVVFHLHETFPNPKRVAREPPYAVRESGYAGFTLPIDIYIKSSEEPKKIRFNYEIDLQQSGPAIIRKVKEKYVFNNPSSELREKLLKGGGVLLNSSSNETSRDVSSLSDKQQLLSKPKLSSSSSDIKKHKIKEHKPEDSFTDVFGPPITKPSKITLEDRISAKGSPSDNNIKSDKGSDKSSKKSKSKHSPKDKDKDRDKEKKDKNSEKKHKEEKKSKERSKDKERKDKNGKRERSPKAKSPSPQRRSPKRPGSPPTIPKRPVSPKRPPSPPVKIKIEEKKLDDPIKDKKSDPNKKKEQKDKEKEKKEHKSHKDKDKNREQKEHKSNKEPKTIKEQPIEVKIKEKSNRSDDSLVVKDPGKIEKPKVENIEKIEKAKHKHKKKENKEKKDKREDKNKEKKSDKKSDKTSSLFDKMYKEDVKDSPKTIEKANVSKPIDTISESNIREKQTKNILHTQLLNESSSSSLSPDESSLEELVKIDKPEKKAKEKKEQNSEKKRKRKHDTNNLKEETQIKVEEPPVKLTKEEPEYSPVKEDKKDNNVDELSQDYMSILKDLQHKIMTLQDNKELQKVVQLIANTGHYEVTAKTFDFDLCALDRETVRRLQEFFVS